MKLKVSDEYVGSAAQGLPILAEELLYVIVRLTHPTKIVETGVGPGVSTAYLLKALEENKRGHLYSIDMPGREQELHETSLEYDAGLNLSVMGRPGDENASRTLRPSGWLVPDELRQRWTLQVGLSSNLLPTLLAEVGEIDLFLHDSEHTYHNMMFEFRCAWPHLKSGGILLSDDINWNNAFKDFVKECRGRRIDFQWFGAIIK
jgi:predicted O-methyltransferase YrrM